MNSFSPVKPPLNPGNLSVSPSSATNLSKSSLPPSNSFSALNLVPEGKGTGSIPAAPTTPEKTGELALKTPQPAPTSNGTVSPRLDTGQIAALSAIPNFNEKNDFAQNLSSNCGITKTESIAEEPAKMKCAVEEKKEEKKPIIETKESSSDSKAISNKDATAQNVSANEIPPSIESTPTKKDEGEEKVKDDKKSDATVRPTERVQADSVTSAPSVKESSAEPASTKVVQEETKPTNLTTHKEEVQDVKKKPEPVPKKKVETEGVAEAESVATENAAKTVSPTKATKRKAKTPVESIAEEDADSRKSKRTRLPTQPYQSPIPELQFIAKLNTPAKTTPKTTSDKIIAFYKGEFLAVRNPEGSFYICQTFQNIHRNSTKIKIRWFNNLPQNIYTPDLYDTTEFDCILTNVTMNRIEKDRWKLPDHEQSRIENILKRALDVEKGVAEQPSITEEHPDGLDLSLYKDEAQLQKKKKNPAPPKEPKPPKAKKVKKVKKETKAPPPKSAAASTPSSSTSGAKKTARTSSYVNRDSTEAKNKPAEKSATKKDKKDKKKKSKSSKKQTNSITSKTDNVSSKTWEPSVKASNSSKVVLSLRKEDSSAKSSLSTETKSTKRTSSVSLRAGAASAAATATPSAATSPAKRRKEEPKSSPSNSTPPASEKTGKVRNAGSAVSAKINSAAMRTTKEKERKAAAATGQRKK